MPTDPKCPACQKECVLGTTKAGKSILMDLRPHFIYCKKRPKKQKHERKHPESPAPVRNSEIAEAVAGLESLGIKHREAVKLVGDGPGDVATLVREGFKRRDAELQAVKQRG